MMCMFVTVKSPKQEDVVQHKTSTEVQALCLCKLYPAFEPERGDKDVLSREVCFSGLSFVV